MDNTPDIFDATVRVDNVPSGGRALRIVADGGQLKRLADLMQVGEAQSFSANLNVEKIRGGLHVTGDLQAKVTQPCVVTFVPVEQVIAEPIDRIFTPGPDIGDDSAPGSELFVDLEADDLPDHFSGRDLDMTPLLLEVLGLAIDLYPRAPGAELPEDAGDEEDESLNPFAALKALEPDNEPDNGGNT